MRAQSRAEFVLFKVAELRSQRSPTSRSRAPGDLEHLLLHAFMKYLCCLVAAGEDGQASTPEYVLKRHSFVLAGSSPGHFRKHIEKLKEKTAPAVAETPSEQSKKGRQSSRKHRDAD